MNRNRYMFKINRLMSGLLTLATVVGLLLVLTASPVQAQDDHVLLSEIVVTPTEGEYVEIHNPTAGAIDLSDYYLTDATYAQAASSITTS